MISPSTWFLTTLLGAFVAAAIASTVNEVQRDYTSPALSGRHSSASTNGNHVRVRL
jgi:hypothetical protein